ncbi:PREDICTED: H-2 class I histocompatibility antigen, alpha chain-like [Poecilia mexicana]|uniref:H-2 class I histocompatibility antigen, alpha chain-like n=1 Tax=Poecilia mexicana TaxID=48701 RepID=UPI00072EC1BB|nr:PREDICTED: H-2 class I histocompatibility antigen, alpha chain-like [Poecilia mexicana]
MCQATGFYPKDIILHIKRNGKILTKDDGVQTDGVHPNNDNTFQRTDYVEVLKSDVAEYSCEVIHEATDVHIQVEWGQTNPSNDSGAEPGSSPSTSSQSE